MALLAFAVPVAACGGGGAGVSGQTGAHTVLVGIAASDGVGIGSTNPDQDNWVARVGARLPTGSRVVNLGISGAVASQALTQELPVALDAAPTVVVVWLGVNDIVAGVPLDGFSRDLASVVGALRSQAGVRVYVANLPDLRQLGAFRNRDQQQLNATVASWNAAIAAVCTQSGARLVDLYAAWSATGNRTTLVSGDGLHPNTAGYQRIADLFWQAIQAAG